MKTIVSVLVLYFPSGLVLNQLSNVVVLTDGTTNDVFEAYVKKRFIDELEFFFFGLTVGGLLSTGANLNGTVLGTLRLWCSVGASPCNI